MVPCCLQCVSSRGNVEISILMCLLDVPARALTLLYHEYALINKRDSSLRIDMLFPFCIYLCVYSCIGIIGEIKSVTGTGNILNVKSSVCINQTILSMLPGAPCWRCHYVSSGTTWTVTVTQTQMSPCSPPQSLKRSLLNILDRAISESIYCISRFYMVWSSACEHRLQ